MGYALQSILGHMPLTEALRTQVSGVPNPFPDEFFKTSPGNRILGDRAKYIRISGERRTSKRVKYGAPAIRRSLRDIGDQAIRCLHDFESFAIDMLVLQQLRAFEKYQQDQGVDWLRYQLQEAARRQQNTRVITTASVLRHGAIYWDSNGDLLPSSSGADTNYTIDFQIPASHKNQISGIVDSSWALASTDIPTHINNLQQFAIQETGMRLTAALYGINVSRYIRQNSFCQAFLSRNPDFNSKLVTTNEIPDGLFGIDKWIPVWSSFYEKDDGTIAEIWDDDLCVFVPNVSQPDRMTWFAQFEGSFPVPKSIEIQRDPMSAINNFELVYGMGSYAQITVSPPGVEVNYFDTFLPGIRNEKAVFQVDCAF